MHNKNRGEVSIEFPSTTITLRPTFQALCEIEAAAGKSIINMLSNFAIQQLRISEIIVIIKAGKKAYDNTLLNNDQITELIESKGIINILPDIVKFLRNGLGIEDPQ
jgi:hypothetical protein